MTLPFGVPPPKPAHGGGVADANVAESFELGVADHGTGADPPASENKQHKTPKYPPSIGKEIRPQRVTELAKHANAKEV